MSDISQQLIEQVKSANADGKALNIVGCDSKSFFGRRPDGETLAMAEHRGIVSYQPAELVVTVRAGTPIVDIEAALDEHNQCLSFDPPRFGGIGSIGGTLACNQSGPSRPWTGSVRDMVLGIRMINGRGESLRFGGQVMKNVAGYDISRLQAGALGCLGAITEISLKVMPKPATTMTLVSAIDKAKGAIDTMSQVSAYPDPITGACWLDGKLYLRYEGAKSAVEGAVSRFKKRYGVSQQLLEETDFWSQLRDQQLPYFSTDQTLWRLSVGTSVNHLLPDAQWLIDWGGAQRWLLGSDYSLDELSKLVPSGMGGVTAFRHGDRDDDVFPKLELPVKALHQRLKTSFDPKQVFNRGRLYSWL
jgi:glycolate oxidase FAD binding subunit